MKQKSHGPKSRSNRMWLPDPGSIQREDDKAFAKRVELLREYKTPVKRYDNDLAPDSGWMK